MSKTKSIASKMFEGRKQADWHLRTYGHLPCECGSKNPMLDCPWEKQKDGVLEWWETTKKQDRVLFCWLDFYKNEGYFPTLCKASEYLGFAGVSSVQRHLYTLKKKGLMFNEPNRYWAIHPRKIEKFLIKNYGENYYERLTGKPKEENEEGGEA